MATIRQIIVNLNGLTLYINVTSFVPSRPMPVAPTPDCRGFDDEGEPGAVEYEVDWFEIDCARTFIEAGGISLEDNEEITTKVFEEMSS